MTQQYSTRLEANTWQIKVGSPQHTLNLCVDSKTSLRLALDTTELRVRAACGGLGSCGACLIQTLSGDFNPPTLAERQKIPAEDLEQGTRLSCQLYAHSDAELYLRDPAPHSEWKSLDPTLLFHAQTGNTAIQQYVYAVAVDLGTTHIRLSLWNRQTGRRMGTRYSINPQVASGADVLTRLDAQRHNEDQQHLTQLARQAIIAGVRDILSRDFGEITPILNAIGKVLIVGNTAMLALVSGNDGAALYGPEHWQQAIACQPTDSDAWRKAWRMPQADISIAQPLAGFVGSDLLAAVLASGLTEKSQPALLADFGTNTEIALWDGQALRVTSVPGGPAFEGLGLGNGLNGAAGAICRVSKTHGGYQLQAQHGESALGYCGSGLVDAMALLLDDGILKPSGRFAEPQASGGYLLQAGIPASAVTSAMIDAFQRAKASTAAAMAQLLVDAGLNCADLATLWVCGAFGRQLNLAHAMNLGLLPIMPIENIFLLADASLAGCEQALIATRGEALFEAIARQAHVLNLSHCADYEERFINHLRLQAMPVTESH